MSNSGLRSAESHSVAQIFERAERVFERRVEQLLHLKRVKARAAGTQFNARKAKRDARTVAGREKLDALVRRLADLATVQEKMLSEDQKKHVGDVLEGAARVVAGMAALKAGEELKEREKRNEEAAEVKEALDTSSCSDDCSVSGSYATKENGKEGMFGVTESVVNFVLRCEEDEEKEEFGNRVHGREVWPVANGRGYGFGYEDGWRSSAGGV